MFILCLWFCFVDLEFSVEICDSKNENKIEIKLESNDYGHSNNGIVLFFIESFKVLLLFSKVHRMYEVKDDAKKVWL